MYETVKLRTALPLPAPAIVHAATAPRRVENVVLTIFWLLLFEGVLRKWVAPEYSRILFFIRDPVVLFLYWKAWRLGAFRNASPLLIVGLTFAAVAICVAFIQSVTFGDSRIIAVVIYGWRQYFLYLPLPFVMAALLNQESLYRFAGHAFLAMVLMAPLVFVQFHSPPSAIVNRGIAEDEALQFQAFAFTGGGVRPSGPFTSTVGVVHSIPSAFALLLAMWMTAPAVRKLSMPLLALAAAAIATCLAVSGSRAAFIHVALVVLGSLMLGMLSRDGSVRGKALILPIVFLGLGTLLFPLVFPDAVQAMLDRVAEAHAGESRASSLGIFGRALYELVDFTRFMRDAPLFGYGFGVGGNGRTYLTHIDPDLAKVFAESDWSRHIVDFGPVFGVLFILFRVVLTASVFVEVVRATRRSGNPFPMLLFAYVGIGLFYGQLTGHGLVGGFLWLYLGWCLVSCRSAAQAR